MTERHLESVASLSELLGKSPLHEALGLRIVQFDPAAHSLSIRSRFTALADRTAGSDQYHGGIIASLIDIAGDFALIGVLGYGVPTINFRTDYLRPAPRGDLTARALVRKAGRTIGVVDVEVQDESGLLVALGRGCYGTRPG